MSHARPHPRRGTKIECRHEDDIDSAHHQVFNVGVKRTLWRALLRLRFVLWQHRRHDRLVLETSLGFPLVVLPRVFNPAIFRSTPVALAALAGEPIQPDHRVLDIGTGSGVLAVSAAQRSRRVVAVDVNPEAVRCARINATLNTVDDRIDVRPGDLFEAVADERFSLIVCNPPFYRGDAGTDFDQALVSPDFAERLAAGIDNHLDADGRALVVLSSEGDEAGFLASFQDAGLAVETALHRDLVSEIVTVHRLCRPDRR